MMVGACVLCHEKQAWILGFGGSNSNNSQLKWKESQMQCGGRKNTGLRTRTPGFWSLSEPQFPFLHNEVVHLGYH